MRILEDGCRAKHRGAICDPSYLQGDGEKELWRGLSRITHLDNCISASQNLGFADQGGGLGGSDEDLSLYLGAPV